MSDESRVTSHAYVRRRGRMTKAQSRAFTSWAADYRLSVDALLERAGDRPLGLEIGFGMGQALIDWARAAPHWQLCGVELYQPGIGALTDALRREDIGNVTIFEQPVEALLEPAYGLASGLWLQRWRIFFLACAELFAFRGGREWFVSHSRWVGGAR